MGRDMPDEELFAPVPDSEIEQIVDEVFADVFGETYDEQFRRHRAGKPRKTEETPL